MKQCFPLVMFVLSVAFLSYAAGFVTAFRHIPPARTLMAVWNTGQDLLVHWQNDLGFAPTRLLVPADDPRRQRVTVADEAAAMEGYRFVSGLMPHKGTLFGAVLLDRAGSELYFWPIDFGKLSPNGKSPNHVFVHGALPLRDGSIVVNFDDGDALARIGPCGEILWVTRGAFHHGLSLSHDGMLWSWENQGDPASDRSDEHIVQIDPATGRRLREISLNDDIVQRHSLYGRFALRTTEDPEEIVYCCDPFHPNDVDVLSPGMAAAFPMFEVGDLLVSLRSLNMVAVIDPETARIKWSKIGPWHQQHDPDFLPNGTISVFDNNMGLDASKIVAVDPATGSTQVVFDGAQRGNFYSWRRGRHQRLANGGIMIAESERGRAVEVNHEGRIVWAYENIYDAERNGLVGEALVLPREFFADGALSCPQPPQKHPTVVSSPRPVRAAIGRRPDTSSESDSRRSRQ